MTAIGRADLADDATLATNAGRVPRTAELDGAIADWTRRHDLDFVLAALEAAQVPSGKVFDVADIVKDAHYIARGMRAVPQPSVFVSAGDGLPDRELYERGAATLVAS